MNRGFIFSAEAILAAGVLVLLAGALVFLSSNAASHDANSNWTPVRALMATQTRELTNQALQGPLPPSDYYCFTVFSYQFGQASPANRLVKTQNCESQETLTN